MSVKPKLLVLGVHSKTEGYPNTTYRIEYLRNSQAFIFSEINRALGIPHAKKTGIMARGKSLLNACIAHLVVLIGYLGHALRHGRPDIAYLPYPAIMTAACISLLPGRWRPARLVIDAFISLYDTVVIDRKMIRSTNWAARLLYLLERRAFGHSDNVIVDTTENAYYLAQLFDLPASKFVPIPLSTDELHFKPYSYNIGQRERCNVLFIGTMIPLHGISVIAKTLQLLAEHENLHFQLIGDGQDAELLERITPLPRNVQWIRDWKSSEDLAKAIRSADICLGIFGKGDKAQRVCPYKIYAYASIGRPIITAKTRWSLAAAEQYGSEAFALVEPGDSEGLAQEILALAQNPNERTRLAAASRDFYQRFLSNHAAHQKLMLVLCDSTTAQQHQQA